MITPPLWGDVCNGRYGVANKCECGAIIWRAVGDISRELNVRIRLLEGDDRWFRIKGGNVLGKGRSFLFESSAIPL